MHGEEADDLVVSEAEELDAPDIARTYVETWSAAYRGILSDSLLEGMSVARLARGFRREILDGEHLVLVARRGGRVVGFSSAGPEMSDDPFFLCEIYTLYVEPSEQRAGVGLALVASLRARLPAPLLVWVLADNAPARAFYLASGALPVRKKRDRVGDRVVDLVGYAYFDADDDGLVA